ncbi:MAG: hypothetical protein JWO10_2259, partial [Microbacteriaceae bacterium]|nr:hypothetical protein [Microbacteriaceae bacterium]
MEIWQTEFDAGTLDDLQFSKEHVIDLPSGVLLYATVTLSGVTIPGTFAQQETKDAGDPFVAARIVRAGRDSLTPKKSGIGIFILS